jgi:ankyrin repeat protein
VTCCDRDGLTALSWSCVQGQLHSAQLLLERGSDIDHADKSQRTPLYLASSGGHEQVVRSRIIALPTERQQFKVCRCMLRIQLVNRNSGLCGHKERTLDQESRWLFLMNRFSVYWIAAPTLSAKISTELVR